MIRKLQEDTAKQAIAAIRQGWHLDRDLFWTRRKRKADGSIPEGRADVGCDSDRRVWVRSASLAIAYDLGEAW